MDQTVKKTIMIAIVIAGFGGTGIIWWTTHPATSGGLSDIPASEKIWVKCNNPDCGAEYEIGKRDYYEFVQQNMNPLANSDPPLTCQKCSKPSVYRAVKCPKCGETFFYGSAPNDFSDRCPKCGFSQTEDSRQHRKGGN